MLPWSVCRLISPFSSPAGSTTEPWKLPKSEVMKGSVCTVWPFTSTSRTLTDWLATRLDFARSVSVRIPLKYSVWPGR